MILELIFTVTLIAIVVGGTVRLVISCRRLPTADVDPERVRRFVKRARELRKRGYGPPL